MNLQPNEALEILNEMTKEKRITPAEIARYREITRIENQLRELRIAPVVGADITRQEAQILSTPKKRAAKRTMLSPDRQASHKLQGRYLGLIRQIPARQRKAISEIAKTKGRNVAIRTMRARLAR